MNVEEVAFSIIVHAGGARSLAFDALREAQAGRFAEAAAFIVKAKEELSHAHRIQTDMLQREAGGLKEEVSLLMVHAQDHLMCAILARDMAEQMIHLYELHAKLQAQLQQ